MASTLAIQHFKQQLIAHRGWQHRFPENSLAGIQAALELGIEQIEIDIQLSADHVPVLCHDHHLLRLCEQDSDVRHCTLATLQTFSFHEASRLGESFFPSPVVNLQQCVELIAQYPQATLYVELKRKSLELFGRESVLTAVHQSLKAIQNQACLISFDMDVLLLAQRRKLPYPLIPVLLDTAQLHSPVFEELNPAMVFCNVKHLANYQDLQQWPCPAAFYEIDNLQQAQALLAAGARGIETFCCGELLAAFEAQAST